MQRSLSAAVSVSCTHTLLSEKPVAFENDRVLQCVLQLSQNEEEHKAKELSYFSAGIRFLMLYLNFNGINYFHDIIDDFFTENYHENQNCNLEHALDFLLQ